MPPRAHRIDRADATYQRFESLIQNRNRRHRERSFLVEGVRQIEALLAVGWPIEEILFTDGGRLSDWAEDVIQGNPKARRFTLPPQLLGRLSGRNEGSELLVVARMPRDDLERIRPSELPLIVVLDRSNSPGNLGTTIRSCDAMGADGLVMTGHSVDLYDPRTVAASVGTLFTLPVVRLPSHRELAPLFERVRREYGDLQIVATSARAERQLDECNFWRPTVLLVGNESDGLSRSYRDLASVSASIPMAGWASSLNVASAVSILLYEVKRQRLAR